MTDSNGNVICAAAVSQLTKHLTNIWDLWREPHALTDSARHVTPQRKLCPVGHHGRDRWQRRPAYPYLDPVINLFRFSILYAVQRCATVSLFKFCPVPVTTTAGVAGVFLLDAQRLWINNKNKCCRTNVSNWPIVAIYQTQTSAARGMAIYTLSL